MNLDLLTIRRFTAGVIYPQVTLTRNDLTFLFDHISQKFDYNTLSLLPDGARIAQGENEIYIQTSRTQINEAIATHFQDTKERATQIFQVVMDQLRVTQYQVFGVKLIAFQPADGSAAWLLEQKLLAVPQEKLAILGSGRRGTGFRFNFYRDFANYDLRIEPYFADLSQIFLELDVNYQTPLGSLEEIGPRIDRVYNYLFGEVRQFLAALVS